MRKLYIISPVLALLLTLSGCGNAPVELPVTTDSTFSLGQTYTIGTQEVSEKNVYGVVIGDNLKNIFSNIGGFLTYIYCQPGEKVSADTVIARIIPNQDDPTIKNLYLQQISLKEQLANLQSSYAITQQNFVLQKQTLSAQIENTQETYDQNNADIQKLEDSIDTFKSQQENTINDAFKKVRDNGGKAEDTDLYDDLYDDRNDIQDMDNDEFSDYLEDMADLMKKASKYASGDTLYSLFIGLSNGFRSSKSTFDTLVGSLASAQNAYANQRNTLSLTLDFADEQKQTIENNKQIQLNALDNQIQSIKQSLDSIANSLAGEILYAGVDGFIKTKSVGEDNKISPNTMICQIVPTDNVNKKIQIYSANKIDIGQVIELYTNDTIVGAAKIEYELPYKDTLTQNYIYEVVHVILRPNLVINEGDRISVRFLKTVDAKEAWIPVSFVFSKLDGNYVRIQSGSGFVETKIQLGDINGDIVKVISGASLGQTIVN